MSERIPDEQLIRLHDRFDADLLVVKYYEAAWGDNHDSKAEMCVQNALLRLIEVENKLAAIKYRAERLAARNVELEKDVTAYRDLVRRRAERYGGCLVIDVYIEDKQFQHVVAKHVVAKHEWRDVRSTSGFIAMVGNRIAATIAAALAANQQEK
jgi:hypothetical protein